MRKQCQYPVTSVISLPAPTLGLYASSRHSCYSDYMRTVVCSGILLILPWYWYPIVGPNYFRSLFFRYILRLYIWSCHDSCLSCSAIDSCSFLNVSDVNNYFYSEINK